MNAQEPNEPNPSSLRVQAVRHTSPITIASIIII
jgi:hypothetical protein